jgi:O-antigen ligase
MNPSPTHERPRWDPWLAATASGALGVAGVLSVGAALSGSVAYLIPAGVFGIAGLGTLLAAGWVDALVLLVVTLPLPALYSTEELRLSPVLPVAALVVAAWYLGKRRAEGPMVGEPLKAMAALVATVTVATVFAEVPLAALRELVNFVLLLGILAGAVDLVRRRPGRARTVAGGLAVVSALAGGAATLEALGVLPGRFPLAGSPLARAAGGFGWPNELGMFMAITFPFHVHAVRRSTSPIARGVAVAGIVLAALGLAATFSRGSWLSVLVAPAVLLAVGEARMAFRFWAAALGAVAVVDLLSGGAVTTRIASTTGDVLVAQRLLLMTAGLLMFQAHPVVGVGPGGFGEALDRFGLQVSGLFDFVGSAHNGYVHMAAEAGLLGLAALLYFVVSTLRAMGRGLRAMPVAGVVADADRDLRVAFLWSFTSACLVTLFEWPFAHGVGELIVLVAGAGMALAPPKRAVP